MLHKISLNRNSLLPDGLERLNRLIPDLIGYITWMMVVVLFEGFEEKLSSVVHARLPRLCFRYVYKTRYHFPSL